MSNRGLVSGVTLSLALPRAHFSVSVLAFALLACGDDGSATSGYGTTGISTSTTTTTTTTEPDPTAGFTDGDPCTPAVVDCPTGVEDCCASAPPGVTCPGVYPHNWTCTPLGVCVHGGCANDEDCGEMYTGLQCMTVEGGARCVAPCNPENDFECAVDRNMPGTVCIETGPTTGYCRQPT